MLVTISSKAKNADEFIDNHYEQFVNDVYYCDPSQDALQVLTVNNSSSVILPYSPKNRQQHYNHIATRCEREFQRDCDINYIVRNFAGPSDPILLESAYAALRSKQLQYTDANDYSIPSILDAYDAIDAIEEDFYKLDPQVRRSLFNDNPLNFAHQLAELPEETLQKINSMNSRSASTPTEGPFDANSEQNAEQRGASASENSPSSGSLQSNNIGLHNPTNNRPPTSN